MSETQPTQPTAQPSQPVTYRVAWHSATGQHTADVTGLMALYSLMSALRNGTGHSPTATILNSTMPRQDGQAHSLSYEAVRVTAERQIMAARPPMPLPGTQPTQPL